MKRKRIKRSSILRKNSVPGDLPRFRDQIESRRRQRRHVQRLANVTSGFRTTSVLVDVRPASGEIQQGHAAQNG